MRQLIPYPQPRLADWLLAVSSGLLATLVIVWLMTLLITPQHLTQQYSKLVAIEFVSLQPTEPANAPAEVRDALPPIPPKLPATVAIPALDISLTHPAPAPMQPLAIEQPLFSAEIKPPVFKPLPSQSAMEAPVFDEELYPIMTHEPIYPSRAKRAGIEGWVNVAFTITTDGSVSDIDILAAQPEGVFENSTRNAMQHWRYKPQLLSGKPAARRVVQTIKFELAP